METQRAEKMRAVAKSLGLRTVMMNESHGGREQLSVFSWQFCLWAVFPSVGSARPPISDRFPRLTEPLNH
jgi:hypothetical protein